MAERRFHLLMVQLFAMVAVVLAALGVYAVVAHTVTTRTREIGLRLFLGARSRVILRMFIARSMRYAALGIAAGLVAAVAASHVMASMLFGIGPGDPVTFAVVAAALATIVIGGELPARTLRRYPRPVEGASLRVSLPFDGRLAVVYYLAGNRR